MVIYYNKHTGTKLWQVIYHEGKVTIHDNSWFDWYKMVKFDLTQTPIGDNFSNKHHASVSIDYSKQQCETRKQGSWKYIGGYPYNTTQWYVKFAKGVAKNGRWTFTIHPRSMVTW